MKVIATIIALTGIIFFFLSANAFSRAADSLEYGFDRPKDKVDKDAIEEGVAKWPDNESPNLYTRALLLLLLYTFIFFIVNELCWKKEDKSKAAITISIVSGDSVNIPIEGGEIVFPSVLFEFDRSKLPDSSLPVLSRLAVLLQQDTTLRVRFDGNTDSVGSPVYNLRLSLNRAEAVANDIKAKGASRERINVYGHADSLPLFSNSSEEGRMLNRRVDIKVSYR